MYYCEESKINQLVMCNVNDLGDIQTWRFNIPYDSTYLFDICQVGNHIYFTGGGNSSSDEFAEQYYQITMKMTIMKPNETMIDRLANMNVARADHTMGFIAPKFLYVIGGYNSSGYLASCEEYNIETDKWNEISPLNEKKKWVAVVAFQNKFLYAFGGCVREDKIPSSLIERLDISNPKPAWQVIQLTSGSELFTGGFHIGSMQITESSILLFGGKANAHEKDSCVLFNLTTLTLEKQPSLLKKDCFYRCKYGIKDNCFAIVSFKKENLHIYNKETKQWKLTLKKIWNPIHKVGLKADTY